VRPPLHLLVVATVYLAASWLVYGWTLNAPFLFDDQTTIQGNPAIRSLKLPDVFNPPPATMGFSRRPVANVSMALNFAAGDLQIAGYRVFNLLLHALNAWLLFVVVRLVAENFVRLSPRAAEAAAFFAGFLWVVHPLSTSAVHYLTQRPEMLAACAFLIMFYAQGRALVSPYPRCWLIAAWFACLLAMGSKESMALLPLLALLFDRCVAGWTWREQWQRRGVYYLALAATLVWPFLLLVKDDSGLALDITSAERLHYFLTVAEGVVRHVMLIFWPSGLVFDYGRSLVGGVGEVVPQLLAVVLAAVFVLWGLWRRSLAAWIGAAVFAVMLPSWINMVPGQPVAEHRFYLPAGLILSILAVVVAVRCARSPGWARPVAVAAAVVSLVFGWLAVQRAALYDNLTELMSQDIATWPRSDRSNMNLGLVLEVDERHDEAAEQYKLAAGNWDTANWRPITALSRTVLRAGDTRQALVLAADAMGRVLSVAGAPDLREFVAIMTGSFRTTGQVGLTLPLLEAAKKAGHDIPYLENQILQISADLGDVAGARDEFRARSAENPVMRVNYAVALAQEGRTVEAVAELDQMLADAPADSDPLKLADVLALKGAFLGSTREGAAALEKVLLINPSHPEALNNLAWLLATAPEDDLRDPTRAVELARRTTRLHPTETLFQGTLAVALAADGREAEAQRVLELAQQLGRVNGNANEQLPDLVRAAAERAAKNR
jgi:tetratricopeptide (TPR) repeat protein